MAIPSGGGTEVLKNVLINGQNATNSTPLTVAQHHIITILSIIVTSTTSTVQSLTIDIVNGGNDHQIAHGDAVKLGDHATFIWNDKFVMEYGDALKITNSGNAIDCVISYIDQDWS